MEGEYRWRKEECTDGGSEERGEEISREIRVRESEGKDR